MTLAKCLVGLSFILFTSISSSLVASPVVSDTVALPTMSDLYDLLEALDAAGEYQTIAHHLFTANQDLRSSELYMYAGLYYSKANLPDSAAVALLLALDNGMANPNILSVYQELAIVKHSDQWKTIDQKLKNLKQRLRQFERFEIDVSPMKFFGKYFGAARRDTTRARALLREYVVSGSPAVRDYYTIRYRSVEAMYQQMIQDHPTLYEQTQQVFANSVFDIIRQETVSMMRTFAALYESAVFPKVYVVSGLNNSGGTATNLGLFVGGEKFIKPIATDDGRLNKQQLDSMNSFEGMQGLIMHELMHFQQNYQDDENISKVLGKIIHEGVCDFLVELCSGEARKEDKITYLDQPKNMKFIADEFKKDRYGEDLSRWMYNGDIKDRPVDIGYTLGYLVCKSYYKNSPDKQKAIYTLLNTDDFRKIYLNSEYAYLLD